MIKTTDIASHQARVNRIEANVSPHKDKLWSALSAADKDDVMRRIAEKLGMVATSQPIPTSAPSPKK